MAKHTTALVLLGVMLLTASCDDDRTDASKPSASSLICVGDGYCLSRSTGQSGAPVTASAPAGGRNKGGHLVHTQKVQVWWNLAPNQWTDVVNKRSHPTALLLADESEPSNDEFTIPFLVPEAEPGTYTVLQIIYGGGGATSVAFRFEVTK